MASAKDTFEANTFEANTFACGTFRGTGVAVSAPDTPGMGFVLEDNRLHFVLEDNRLHFTQEDSG